MASEAAGGSIYQRSDGRWVAQVEAGRGDEGRRRYVRRVRRTRADAETALATLRRDEPGVPLEDLIVGTGEYAAAAGHRMYNGAASLVYIAHGATGPLYVGVTDNFFVRMRMHRRKAQWWADVQRFTWEAFPSRAAALEREAQLVRRLDPPGNRAHRLRDS